MTSPYSKDIRSALIVCGKFHFFNYAAELADRGVLKQFLYSHRLKSKKLFKRQISFNNLFFKEYLFQLHNKFLGTHLASQLHPLIHLQWDLTASAVLKPVDLVHFLMHGNCHRVLAKAKSMGAKRVGEAVNSHPNDYLRVLEEEHANLGLPGKAPRPKFVERIINEIPLTDRILVPSDFVAKSYISNGVPIGKIHKIPYGGNLTEFTPGDADADCFRVICVAQVVLRKGHQYLLKAWKRLNLPRAELHCYGNIDPLVLDALKKIGAPNVFFHGSVSKSKLISELQRSSMFVLPTKEEGFAVSILEALACGLPVVTTTQSGAEGVIANNENGLLLPAGDIDGLCQSIEKLYSDEVFRKHIGRAGRSLVENGFNWESYVDQLIQFYHSVCDKTGS